MKRNQIKTKMYAETGKEPFQRNIYTRNHRPMAPRLGWLVFVNGTALVTHPKKRGQQGEIGLFENHHDLDSGARDIHCLQFYSH